MPVEADPGLIERARSDALAFARIYDLYLQRVYAFCLTHTGNRDDAEDLTAQTFERALKNIGRYQDRGVPLSSWLFRIAANLVVDRGRRGRKIIFMGDHSLPEKPSERHGESDPARLVEDWERATLLRTHIATLPTDQQLAVRLRYWEGYSLAEVASAMGRTEGAVKQLIHRALGGLRERMRKEAVSVV